MDVLFFDTSALVKRYAEEPGSQRVDELIESDSTVVISSLAIIVSRRSNENTIEINSRNRG